MSFHLVLQLVLGLNPILSWKRRAQADAFLGPHFKGVGIDLWISVCVQLNLSIRTGNFWTSIKSQIWVLFSRRALALLLFYLRILIGWRKGETVDVTANFGRSWDAGVNLGRNDGPTQHRPSTAISRLETWRAATAETTTGTVGVYPPRVSPSQQKSNLGKDGREFEISSILLSIHAVHHV